MRAELKKIKQHKLWLKDEIEKNKTLIKKSQENKISNQKNKNRIKNNNIWQVVI